MWDLRGGGKMFSLKAQLFIVKEECATATGRNDLISVKAENSYIAHRACVPTARITSQRFCSIFNESNIIFVTNFT